jgi:hypothetical protein
VRVFLTVVASAIAVGGCSIATQIATQQDSKKAKECFAEARTTPEGQLLHKRIWSFDSTDTADKLSDPNPLTPPERDALIQLNNRMGPCRQIIIAHDNQYAAWGDAVLAGAFSEKRSNYL